MDQGRVSVSYAKAFLGWASDHGCASDAYSQSDLLLSFIDQNPNFYQILHSPMVSLSKKLDSIGRILRIQTPLLEGLVVLMVKNHRERSLKNTLLAFQTLYRRKFGVAKVIIETAVDLTEATCASIDQFLSTILGKRIEMDLRVKPSLIGGIVLVIDDQLLDKSVKRELEKFHEQLVGTVTYQ